MAERSLGQTAPLAADPAPFEEEAPMRERPAGGPQARPGAYPGSEPSARRPAEVEEYDVREPGSPGAENAEEDHVWGGEASLRLGQWDEAAPDGPDVQPMGGGGALETGAMSGPDSVRDIWSRLQAMGADDAPSSGGERGASGRGGARSTWESFEQHGVISAFAGTVKGVLFAPGDFFDQLPPVAGKVRPLIFAVAVSVIVMIFALVWEYFGLKLGGLRDLGHTEGFEGLGRNAMGGLALLGLAPLFTMAFLFLDAALSHLLLGLVRAATRSFDETFRTLCYAGAPWILAVFPLPYAYLAAVILIWHMALQAISLRKLHETGYPQVLASVLIKWSLYFMASFAVLHMLVTRG